MIPGFGNIVAAVTLQNITATWSAIPGVALPDITANPGWGTPDEMLITLSVPCIPGKTKSCDAHVLAATDDGETLLLNLTFLIEQRENAQFDAILVNEVGLVL